MDIYIISFIVVSVWVIIDFAVAGLKLMSMAKEAKPATEPFVKGIAWLLLIISAFNFLWLVLIGFEPFIQLSQYQWTRPVATGAAIALGLAAIIGRRYWWNTIVKAKKEGV